MLIDCPKQDDCALHLRSREAIAPGWLAFAPLEGAVKVRQREDSFRTGLFRRRLWQTYLTSYPSLRSPKKRWRWAFIPSSAP